MASGGAPTPEVETSPEEARWLTRGVGGIGLASLLADVGHEVPTAPLPSFLDNDARCSRGRAWTGIEGVADASAGMARFGGGALADDPERRRAAAVGGYTATAVLSSLIGVCTATWQVGVLPGAWTARAACQFATRSSPTWCLGSAYGRHTALRG